MDGLYTGNPYEQMDDLGGFHPYFWVDTPFFSPSAWDFVCPFAQVSK